MVNIACLECHSGILLAGKVQLVGKVPSRGESSFFKCSRAWIHTFGALRPLKACGNDGHLSIVNRYYLTIIVSTLYQEACYEPDQPNRPGSRRSNT